MHKKDILVAVLYGDNYQVIEIAAKKDIRTSQIDIGIEEKNNHATQLSALGKLEDPYHGHDDLRVLDIRKESASLCTTDDFIDLCAQSMTLALCLPFDLRSQHRLPGFRSLSMFLH